jgi:hypothetical protein
MNLMLCRNRVENYARWKLIFDSHAAAQREAGFRLLHLGREIDDPENVFFLFEVTDLERARAFIESPESAEVGRQAGVIDGEVRFLTDA